MLHNYIDEVRKRQPHDRRQAAMRIAASVTGILAIGWLATLGVRLASPHPKTAAQAGFEAQVASIISAFSGLGSQTSMLEVASSTANRSAR